MGTINDYRIRTTKELIANGWTKATIAWATHTGRIHRVFHGVYTDQPPTPEIVAHALLHVRPDAVFEQRTAFELYNHKPLTFPLQARVPTGALRHQAHGLIELRRSKLHVTCKRAGLPVVPVAELANSLLPEDPTTPVPEELSTFVEQQYAGKHGMQHLLQDLKYMGRSQKTRIREFTEHHIAVGVDSPPEADLIKALRREGFKVTPQFQLGQYRWDAAITGLKVVIDVDSKRYHMDDEQAFVVDRWKTNTGIMQGWIALRVTATCVHKHLPTIIALLNEIRRQKQQSPRRFPLIDIKPVWQWHHHYTRDWINEGYFDDHYAHT